MGNADRQPTLIKLIVIGVAALSMLGMGGNAGDDGRLPAVVASTMGQTGGSGTIAEGVAGCVTEVDGQPIEGAFIQARSLGEEGPPVPDIAILTVANGCYTWPLRPGSFELTVTADGYQPKAIRVTVAEGKVTTADVVLQKGP